VHVAIAIVTFRNTDDIVRCLAALDRQTHADFEVIVCENGGPKAFQALTAVLPAALSGGQRVRAVQASGNLGYGGGVNVCLKETPDADAWWVLNPDTSPEPGALAALVERLAEGTCDAAGCVIHLEDGTMQSYGGQWRPWLARAISIGHGALVGQGADLAAIELRQNYLNGSSMLVGRRFLEAAGPMREDYFLYCEEIEWCLRATRRGMRLGFAAGARVLHYTGTTTGASADLGSRTRLPVYLNLRNAILLTRDMYPARLPVALVALPLLVILRYGRSGAWRQVGYGLAGWAAGLRGERGAPGWMDAA
jgi:GT2 family glycosyltransferase